MVKSKFYLECEEDLKELTKFDAFSFRFVKFVEMALRFFATLEIYLYGEKSESLRKRLLVLERAGFISEGEIGLRARALRKEIVYAYLPDELERLYANMEELAKNLLEHLALLKKRLEKFVGEIQKIEKSKREPLEL